MSACLVVVYQDCQPPPAHARDSPTSQVSSMGTPRRHSVLRFHLISAASAEGLPIWWKLRPLLICSTLHFSVSLTSRTRRWCSKRSACRTWPRILLLLLLLFILPFKATPPKTCSLFPADVDCLVVGRLVFLWRWLFSHGREAQGLPAGSVPLDACVLRQYAHREHFHVMVLDVACNASAPTTVAFDIAAATSSAVVTKV